MEEQSFGLWIGGIVVGIIQLLSVALGKILWNRIDRNEKNVGRLQTSFSDLRLSIEQRHPTKEELHLAVKDLKDEMKLGFSDMKATMETGDEKLRQSVITLFGDISDIKDRK